MARLRPWLARHSERRPRCAAGLALAAYLCGTLLLAAVEGQPADPATPPRLPRELAQNDRYASSAACRECHADQYESWHRTYHRTMTQVASAENFVGKFDGTEVDSDGLLYRVFERDGEFWAEMPDPDVMMDRQATFEGKSAAHLPVEPLHWRDVPRVERRVVMSTGSHHYQTYWVESAKYPGTLMTLPLVYLIRDQRWIPRESAFLYPPGPRRMVTVWNDHCINCHSTGPVPAPFADRDPATGKFTGTGFRTHVGDVGISCEACHGPAAEHVQLRRAEQAAAAGGGNGAPAAAALAADPIVHPANLDDHRRTTQICGQCHGVYIRDDQHGLEFRDRGIDFVPGNDLLATRHYIFPPHDDPDFYATEQERLEAIRDFDVNRAFFRQRFWENGDVLAGGREFTGLAMTGCYLRGKITCLSCHSMHGGDPNDQLIPGLSVDAACQGCHTEERFNAALASHTRHAADSAGSSCMNCHMPHATYALFGAIRTHKIGSPDLAASARHGVPNACNLCHLDKTLAWTADRLADWYGYEQPPLSDEQRQVSAAVLWLLKGHAAQRAIAAWHVGWQEARAASGDDWLAPIVAPLLADPYGVVRYVASSSLRKLPNFGALKYDFMAPTDALTQAVDDVVGRWRQRQPAPPSRTGAEVLISAVGTLDEPAVERLLSTRDNRPVEIKE